jgi:hypothetical protein
MLFSQPPRVSRRTAQRNLARATKFLSTLSRVPEVRAALERGAGYSEQDHALGWSLLLIALGYIRKGTAATPGEPVSQQAALIELDEWDGVNFERARATLKFNFPEQHDYLFQGLTAATGADAIGTVQTFVERVAALRATAESRIGSHRVVIGMPMFDSRDEVRREVTLGAGAGRGKLPPRGGGARYLVGNLRARLSVILLQSRAERGPMLPQHMR